MAFVGFGSRRWMEGRGAFLAVQKLNRKKEGRSCLLLGERAGNGMERLGETVNWRGRRLFEGVFEAGRLGSMDDRFGVRSSWRAAGR